MHRRRVTKIKVLEIVWAYLYSGREQQAWDALAEMWPSSDLDRISLAYLGCTNRRNTKPSRWRRHETALAREEVRIHL
jgi:hypothetical protein